MDSIVALLIICLLVANLIAVIFLIKRKQPDQIDNNQIFKDEVSSLKNSFNGSINPSLYDMKYLSSSNG